MNWMGRAEAEAGRADGRSDCHRELAHSGIEMAMAVLKRGYERSDGGAYDKAYWQSYAATLRREQWAGRAQSSAEVH